MFSFLAPNHLFMFINKSHRNTFIKCTLQSHTFYKSCKMFARSHSKKNSGKIRFFSLYSGVFWYVNVFFFWMLNHLGWNLIMVQQCTHFQLCFIIHLYVFLSPTTTDRRVKLWIIKNNNEWHQRMRRESRI